MAYDYFATQQDDEDNQGGQAKQLSQDSSVVTGNGAPASAGQVGSAKPSSSGQFTNLQAYLDANKGVGFGQKAAGDAQKQVDSAVSTQDTAGQSFRQKVDASAVNEDADTIEKAKTDPTKVDVTAFAKMRDARYAGPQGFSDSDQDYINSFSASNTAKQLGEQTKSEGGRKAFLADQYGTKAGRSDYSSGMQNLDNLILQNDPESKQAFGAMQDNATAAWNRFDALQKQLDGYAKTSAGATAKARTDARGAIGIDDAGNWLDASPYRTSLSQIDQKVQQGQQQRQQEQALRERLSGYQATPEDLKALGLDPNQRAYGVKPGEYFDAGIAANRSNVADADAAARLRALSGLAGHAADESGIDSAQIGQFKPQQFNQSAYDAAQKSGEQRYREQQAALKSSIDTVLHPTVPLHTNADWDALIANYKNLLAQESALNAAQSRTIGGAAGTPDAIYQPMDPNVIPIAGGPIMSMPTAPVTDDPYRNLPPLATG